MVKENSALLEYMEKLYHPGDAGDKLVLQHYSIGELVIRQNHVPGYMYVIRSGIVKCFYTTKEDKVYIIEFLGQGAVLGEIELIRRIPAVNGIMAITALEVFQLEAAYASRLLADDPVFNRLLMIELATRVGDTGIRAARQQLLTAENTVAGLLALLKQQDLHLSKPDMAAYLGVSLRSLNRTLRAIEGR